MQAFVGPGIFALHQNLSQTTLDVSVFPFGPKKSKKNIMKYL